MLPRSGLFVCLSKELGWTGLHSVSQFFLKEIVLVLLQNYGDFRKLWPFFSFHTEEIHKVTRNIIFLDKTRLLIDKMIIDNIIVCR